jgi:hypothetical protein
VLDLADYPYAFIGRADLADLAFVLPDQPAPDAIASLAAIAAQLGRSAEAGSLFPRVVFASDQAALGDYPFQFLIGRPSENPAISALNDQLPLPFEPGSDAPQSQSRVAQIASPNGSIGFVQAVLTENGEPRLVVTGSGSDGLTWAAAAVSQPALMRELSGDLAILDGSDSLTTASIRQPAAPVEETADAQTPAVSSTRWVLWLAAALFLIAILVLLMIVGSDFINRRKARKSYEPPTL